MRETRGHLVFRPEGEMWNAYWRPEEHPITGWVLLGSVRLNLTIEHTSIKTGFMKLMKLVIAESVVAVSGTSVIWGKPHPAPESERGGNA